VHGAVQADYAQIPLNNLSYKLHTVHEDADVHSGQEQAKQLPSDKYVPFEHERHCLASLHSWQLVVQD
jgi:hypothetical protein